MQLRPKSVLVLDVKVSYMQQLSFCRPAKKKVHCVLHCRRCIGGEVR